MTLRPCTPISWSASFTSSSLNGLMTASIFLIAALPELPTRGAAVASAATLDYAGAMPSTSRGGAQWRPGGGADNRRGVRRICPFLVQIARSAGETRTGGPGDGNSDPRADGRGGAARDRGGRGHGPRADGAGRRRHPRGAGRGAAGPRARVGGG